MKYNVNSYVFLKINSILQLLEEKNEISQVREILCTAEPFFDSTEQQDAHEALVLLLEVLHRSTLTSRAQELGLSQIMSQDFSAHYFCYSQHLSRFF